MAPLQATCLATGQSPAQVTGEEPVWCCARASPSSIVAASHVLVRLRWVAVPWLAHRRTCGSCAGGLLGLASGTSSLLVRGRRSCPKRNLRGSIFGSSANLGRKSLSALVARFRRSPPGTSAVLARSAPPSSCVERQHAAVQEPAAIPFGKCCAAARLAQVKRRRRRGGEVRVARNAYPQSPSWLPGCRRHPTLRWCRVGWSPCTSETFGLRLRSARLDWDGVLSGIETGRGCGVTPLRDTHASRRPVADGASVEACQRPGRRLRRSRSQAAGAGQRGKSGLRIPSRNHGPTVSFSELRIFSSLAATFGDA